MKIALLALALVTFIAAPARADDTRAAKREADRHFKNGVKLFDESKYSEALAEFEQAYALASHPLVLYNLASTHRALSQYAQAVDFYNRFLAEGKGVVKPAQLARGQRELDDVLRLIARVDVTTEPEGATVSVDGRVVGPTPLGQPLILGPGDHVVGATLDGHQPAERAFRVAAGDTLAVALTLARKVDEPAAVETGGGGAAVVEPAPETRDRRFAVSAAYGTNAIEVEATGAPVLGLAYSVGDRLSVGVEAVLVAYSAVPEVRFRVVGDALSLHAIAAVPISFTDGEESEMFVAGAGGLGVRFRAHERL
ncbi:MAG TPA: PEGA domain-containing protein [Kofleriaceae bacterium]|nr:PEGA domain-containing protein [Kofleriaceae bacterium]